MNTDQFETIAEKVDCYARGFLPRPRYDHSVRVAELCRSLCVKFGLDPAKGYLAGLGHDICKSGRDKWLLLLASQDGHPLSDIEAAKPALLHGRAASVLLATDFGVTDRSVLDAIRHHTFGSPGLDQLGKILFVSDKIEPGRIDYDGAQRKKILESDLDGMVRLVLEDNIRYLEERGKAVSMDTLAMLEEIEGRI
jgi:predicted HD superfamily hydrolase involved in NAD metabolism